VLEIDQDSFTYILDIILGWVYDVISYLICIFYTFFKLKYLWNECRYLQTVNGVFILSCHSMWYTKKFKGWKFDHSTTLSRLLLISDALCAIFHVICAMQLMWAKQLATFFNTLLNTNTRQLGIIFFKPTAVTTYWMRAILIFWESVRANSIAYYSKCFTSRNSSLLGIPGRTQYVRNLLFVVVISL